VASVALPGGGAAPAAPAVDEYGRPETLPPLRTMVGFGLMCVGMFMAILDIQIVAASLGQIQAGLAASETEVSWVQTSYLVAEVVMVPLSGFLVRAFGMRNLFVMSAAGFVVTSVLCATATTLNEMILYRALQGFIGGAMIPVAYGASFVLFPRRYQTQVTVAIALLITLAPTVGPTIGGLLTDAFSWHWIFLINVVPGVLITFGVLAFVDQGKPDYALLRRIDIVGLVLMALFLGGLDYVLEEGGRANWFDDPTIFWVSIMVAFASVLFLWRCLASPEPIVDLTPFTNRNFAFATTLQLMLGLSLFGFTYAYPVFLGRIAGYSAGQIGETVFVTGLTMMLAAPIAGRIARKTDPRFVCSAGFLLLALSAWLTRDITPDWRFGEFVVPQVLRGLGLICCIVSTTVVGFATLSVTQATAGAPLFVLMRNLGGALGLAIINTLLIERTHLHWARLVDGLSGSRAEVIARMAELEAMMQARGLDPDSGPLRMMALEVQRQAYVLSFVDVFHVLALALLAIAFVPLILRRPPTFESAAPGH